MSLEKALHDRPRIDAAHVLNLGTGHRLAIRDDREGFECGLRKAKRALLLKLLQVAREFSPGSNLEAAGDFPDLKGAILVDVLRVEFVDEILRLPRIAVGDDVRDAIGRDRLGR